MKLVNFEVKKFKGIGNLKISFSTTPNNKVYTLVGINDEIDEYAKDFYDDKKDKEKDDGFER